MDEWYVCYVCCMLCMYVCMALIYLCLHTEGQGLWPSYIVEGVSMRVYVYILIEEPTRGAPVDNIAFWRDMDRKQVRTTRHYTHVMMMIMMMIYG